MFKPNERVIICGGRDFGSHVGDQELMDAVLDKLPSDVTVIHGGARGADRMAGQGWAARGGIVDIFSADWTQFGRAAGVLRNQAMLESGADRVIAFPGGRGTEDMVRRANRAGVHVLHVVRGVGQ